MHQIAQVFPYAICQYRYNDENYSACVLISLFLCT